MARQDLEFRNGALLTNAETIRTFLQAYHAAAAEAFEGIPNPGVLNLNSLRGKDMVLVGRFRIGDVEGMTQAAIAESDNSFNVYVEARTVRPDTERGKRGGEADTVGVFALVVDSDADKGKVGIVVGLPTITVSTSGDNRHLWYVFGRAIPLAQAKQIGAALRAATGSDHDTGVPSQPYRLPGTVNYASPEKQARGRPAAEATSFTRLLGPTWDPDELAAILPKVETRPPHADGAPEDFDTNEVSPERVQYLLVWQVSEHHRRQVAATTAELGEWAAKEGKPVDRSAHAYKTIGWLREDGLTLAETYAVLRAHPASAVCEKYGTGERLRAEVARAWAKVSGRPRQPEQRARSSASGEDGGSDDGNGLDWRSALIVSTTGRPKPLLANAITALRHAPPFSGRIARDEFALRSIVTDPLPWDGEEAEFPRLWTSDDDIRAAEWLQHEGVYVGVDIVAQAVEGVAAERRVHPIRQYLSGLTWDGVGRINTWVSKYLGVEPSLYAYAVGRCFLIGGVARVSRPGCKLDTMLILEGRQGAGKSTAFQIIAGRWFSDDLPALGTKDAAMVAGAAWVIEVSELDALTRSEATAVKAFLSRDTDRYRPPYGRRVIEVPRQSVLCGTSNTNNYLKDETGGRRFWPLRVGAIDLAALREDRDQLWAEAVHEFQAGATWWLDRDDLIEAAKAEAAARYVGDPWDEKIADFVDGRDETSVAEVLQHLGVEPSRQGQADMNRVARSLVTLGFEKKRKRHRRTRRPVWVYKRVAT